MAPFNTQSLNQAANVCTVFYAGVAVLITWVLCLIVYRIWFHPLSKFPGPLMAKVTNFWSVYHSIRGDCHLALHECHSSYGSVVRYGPNKLSTSSISGMHDIYDAKSLLKSEAYATINPAPGSFSVFTSIDKDMHRQKRKVFGQAFSDRAVRSFEATVLEQVDIFVDELTKLIPADDDHNDWSAPVDMTVSTRYYATDVMGEFGFGKSFEMQTSDENKFLLKACDGAAFVAGIYTAYPKLKRWGLGKLVAIAGMATKERFGQLSKALVDQRINEPNAKKRDILYFMNKAKEDPKQVYHPSMDEIWAESRFTLIAGAETTGTSIAACLFYLSRYPACCEKLTASLRSTFKSKEEIQSSEKLTRCTYLWAVVDEAMRLSPSILGPLWRQVRHEGFTVDGEPIPPGCDIGVSSYIPQHNEDVFSEPFAFRPERWLETEEDETSHERIRAQRRAFVPFSLGPRKCLGAKMAVNNIALCLARTLWALDMRRPGGQVWDVGGGKEGAVGLRGNVDEFQLFEHVTARHEGPWLEWRRRTD